MLMVCAEGGGGAASVGGEQDICCSCWATLSELWGTREVGKGKGGSS